MIKALRLALLALLRDGKSGELRVLMLALLVAVSALTAVGFFTTVRPNGHSEYPAILNAWTPNGIVMIRMNMTIPATA